MYKKQVNNGGIFVNVPKALSQIGLRFSIRLVPSQFWYSYELLAIFGLGRNCYSDSLISLRPILIKAKIRLMI